MAIKNPLCNYSGSIEELNSGDVVASTVFVTSLPATGVLGVRYGRNANGDWSDDDDGFYTWDGSQFVKDNS